MTVPPVDAPAEIPVDPASTDAAPDSPAAEATAPASADLSLTSRDAGAVDSANAGGPDAGAPDLPLVENGHPCAAGAQCRSGLCADGVCCTDACTGPCKACNLPGKEGTCTPVPDGQTAAGDCPAQAVSTCGLDGTCDGRGACRRYPIGTVCAPGSCTGATETAASTCDGAGMCRPGAARSCSPNLCKLGSCATTCAQQSDCQTGFFCAGGTCALRQAVGTTCTSATQCASGQCADGVCCNTACDQLCYACNVAPSLGFCLPVPTGQDPRDQCPAELSSTCGRSGTCNGSGACQLHPLGTVCAAATCSGDTAVAERLCNGLGVCVPGTTRDCGPMGCGDGVCTNTCASASGCPAGFACSNQACIPDQRVLHWRFDEAAGPLAMDSSGNSFHGTYTAVTGLPTPSAMVPPVAFPNPRSLAFLTASRQAVQLANMPVALRPANNITVTAWYRATTVGTIGGEVVSGGDNYILRVDPYQVEFSKHIATTHTPCYGAATGQLDGAWHHLAGISSPAGLIVYLDGVPRCTNNVGGDIVYNRGTDFWVGRHGNGGTSYDFDGNIDDVRVYTRVLTPAEIVALAHGGP